MADGFLPISRADMEERGWDQVDFAYVSGDAYLDHPSFGTALIARLLEAHGFRIGIIAQPDWRDPESIAVFGRPRLGFLVSSGNMDSMVNHYTVAKRRRRIDAYSPGGVMGLRPDRACIVYGNLIRHTFKDVPIILGGIEASLRRLAHYDYWADAVRRSILLDSGADLVSYGMGEKSIVAIAEALDAGLGVSDLTFIPGTVYRARSLEAAYDPLILPPYERVVSDKRAYAESFGIQYRNLDPFSARTLAEEYPHGVFVVQNPPSEPLTTEEMDAVYDLPYQRTYHPVYEKAGGVPAIREVKFSLTSNRGCLGECAFCALNFHQGRIIQARSHDSLIREAKLMTRDPAFKGYIHDVGGPTADFRVPACEKQRTHGACVNRRCLAPEPCPNLNVTHEDYVELLRELSALPGVKKVFVRSGIRFDYVMLDSDPTFLRELVKNHVSGQLKVAPEHVSDSVLRVMGKPPHEVYERFAKTYAQMNRKLGKKQYLVPYLMSSHPGSTLKEAVELAEFCRDLGYNPEQVSDFYPTPSTVSTCIYHTGLDPRTMEPVYCPTNPHEKALQRALIQYRNPKNHDLVREALHRAGREDLIGFDEHCLVRPARADRKSDAGRDTSRTGKAHARGAGKAHGTSPHGSPNQRERRAKGSSGSSPAGYAGKGSDAHASRSPHREHSARRGGRDKARGDGLRKSGPRGEGQRGANQHGHSPHGKRR